MRNECQRHRLSTRLDRLRPVAPTRGQEAFLLLSLALSLALATVLPARGDDTNPAVLDPAREPLSEATFRAVGFDRAPPRELVLWRFDGETYHRIAETRSESDGRFDFGIQTLPLVRADFGVTGRGEPPDASHFRRYERVVPAPVVAAEATEDDELYILTSRAEGEIWIHDHDTGRLLARVAVDGSSQHGTSLDLARTLPRNRPRAIALEHVLGDGRRSLPEVWLIGESTPGEP